MKKYLGVIMSLIFIVGIIGGLLFTMGVFGVKNVAKAKGIHLNTTELDLKLKGNYQLNLDYELETQAKPKVVYVSDNPDVVRVNELTGYLEARNYGMAEITVMVEDDPTINDTCYVYVTDKKNVTKISVKDPTIEIGIGESRKIEVEVSPVSARPKLTWTSSDESIVTIKNGMARGIKEGEAIIEVKEKGGRAARVNVKVKNVEIQEIKYNNAISQIHVGESKNLNIIYVPSNATKKELTWESSDTSIISVENGEIKGIKEGRAKITARTEEGHEVSTEIEVIKRSEKIVATEIKLDIKNAKIKKGESIKINATVIPNNAENKSLTWTSSNNSIAIVNNGTIRGIKEGTTKIKVKTTNGIEKEIEVEVQEKTQEVLPTGVSIKEKTIMLEPNKEKVINATVSPSNAENKSLVWTSNNEKVAIVDSKGKVTTIKEGSAIITAKTINGKIATIKIMVAEKEVEKPTTSGQIEVTLNKTSMSLKIGESETLKANVIGSNKRVTWVSSNSNIATVDENGKVVAKAVGTATIVGRIEGGKTGTCKVVVSEKNESTTTPISTPSSTIKPTPTPVSKVYKVTFNPDNGSSSITMEVKENGTVTPPVVSKEAHTFDGWYIGNTKFDKSTKITKDMTITAKWTRKPSKTIRVGTLNMGAFRCGTGKLTCKPTWKDFKNVFINSGIDIVGIQEGSPGAGDLYYSATKAGLSNVYSEAPSDRLGILSKYAFKSKSMSPMTTCRSKHALLKTVINVNGVDISFYDAHFCWNLENKPCSDIHFGEVANIVKNDPNPAIVVADFNVVDKGYFNQYFSPIGGVIAAYDNTTTNMWGRTSFCDAVVVFPRNHISVVKGETIVTYRKQSDHNFVIATLEIY